MPVEKFYIKQSFLNLIKCKNLKVLQMPFLRKTVYFCSVIMYVIIVLNYVIITNNVIYTSRSGSGFGTSGSKCDFRNNVISRNGIRK